MHSIVTLMIPASEQYSVRRVVTECGVCSLSTGTLSAIVMLVVFRILLGDCDISCDEYTAGAKVGDSGSYECDGAVSSSCVIELGHSFKFILRGSVVLPLLCCMVSALSFCMCLRC